MSAPINDPTITLLPDNATAFEASHSAVDQRLLAIDTDLVRTEREAATCTLPVLPFLAWERSVHHWTGADDALDRSRTASSFEDHANYGSPSAYEDELRIDLAYDAITIREWFEVQGFEYPDFRVVVHVVADGPAPPAYADVLASAIRRKNVRDWPNVIYEVAQSGPLGIASAAVLNGTINSLPLDPTPHDYGTAYYGARGTVTGTIHSRPL